MKVSFTTKEYTRLLELVHMGLHVVGAHPTDPASMPDRYEAIAQKVYGLAPEFGCAELVETDVNGEAFPNERLTEGVAAEKLDEFRDFTFWSELVSRLSNRDFRVEIGAPADEEERLLTPAEDEKLHTIEDAYWREFESNGVKHLVLLRGGRG